MLKLIKLYYKLLLTAKINCQKILKRFMAISHYYRLSELKSHRAGFNSQYFQQLARQLLIRPTAF